MGTISRDSPSDKHFTIMKHSLFLCVVLIAALGPAVEAFFLGPIAVGVGLGALAVTKGLILGSILGRSRTSSRGGRSYTRYSRTNHYHQTNNYYTHYTQPRTYYYSSKSYSYRGKREIPDYSEEELNRMVREVRDSTLTDEWYMEMVKKDQDDCTKRLICEVSHKKASGQSMNSVEEGIIEVFGEGSAVDTSKSTAVFDFAAQAGKYWKVGGIGCEFFSRCDTPYDDMVAMIENELNEFAELEESFNGDKRKVASKMSDEKDFIDNEIKKLQI